jgi:hypothetical protein
MFPITLVKMAAGGSGVFVVLAFYVFMYGQWCIFNDLAFQIYYFMNNNRQCLFLQQFLTKILNKNFEQIVVKIAANLILTTNDITESIQ